MVKYLCIFIFAVGALSAVELNEKEIANKLLQDQGLKINHWVLAQPNGKPITVMDLAKRLEMAYRQQFPQYVNNRDIRYQFYSSQWRYLLNDMINNELILADAEEKKVSVNDGEVRKEVEEMFGPNVVETIDEIGLSYEEALEIVKTNLIVSRMRGYMVNSRAMAAVTPDHIQKAFTQYQKEHPPVDCWKYTMLSLRHPSMAIAESAGITAKSLARQGLTLEELAEALKEKQASGLLDPNLQIRLSDTQEISTAKLAKAYKHALVKIHPGQISEPVLQNSKSGGGASRLLYLISYEKEDPPSFADLENQLQNQLFQAAAEKEHQRYIAKLRNHFEIDDNYLNEMIPRGFQPFSVY